MDKDRFIISLANGVGVAFICVFLYTHPHIPIWATDEMVYTLTHRPIGESIIMGVCGFLVGFILGYNLTKYP